MKKKSLDASAKSNRDSQRNLNILPYLELPRTVCSMVFFMTLIMMSYL